MRSWRHIISCDNPTDLISRDANPQALQIKLLWWSEYTWLAANANQWPVSANKLTITPEERVVKIASMSCRQESDLLQRYSDYTRLLCTMIHCIRFISNSRIKINNRHSKTQRELRNLTITELTQARKTLECLT